MNDLGVGAALRTDRFVFADRIATSAGKTVCGPAAVQQSIFEKLYGLPESRITAGVVHSVQSVHTKIRERIERDPPG